MSLGKLTYSKSGVNIKKADKFVKHISSISRKSDKSGNFKNIGGFGAISAIPKKLKEPHIVTSTDGVGTKIEIANQFKKFNTIGIDLVAMCVNDLIVQGAKPYFFLDYISIDKINLKFLDNKNSFTEDDWSEIYNLSLKTYVDESDKSRERTAGAGLTDND